jgi:homoserine kinase
MSATVVVRVPASTANVGAGFDRIAIAVDRWLTAWVVQSGRARSGVTVRRRGTLTGLGPPQGMSTNRDMLVQGFAAACRIARRNMPGGLTIDVTSAIPVARGLGSSAASAVAGLMLANAALRLGLTVRQLLVAGAELEGHPDNVGAAILGGGVLIIGDTATTWRALRLSIRYNLRLVLAVPALSVETRRARARLPTVIPHATGVAAAMRSAALVVGLAHPTREVLRLALDDVLHVPYRRELVQGYDEVVAAAHEAGALGATLSGSGPSIVAITDVKRAPVVRQAMVKAWRERGVKSTGFVSLPSVSGARLIAG